MTIHVTDTSQKEEVEGALRWAVSGCLSRCSVTRCMLPCRGTEAWRPPSPWPGSGCSGWAGLGRSGSSSASGGTGCRPGDPPGTAEWAAGHSRSIPGTRTAPLAPPTGRAARARAGTPRRKGKRTPTRPRSPRRPLQQLQRQRLPPPPRLPFPRVFPRLLCRGRVLHLRLRLRTDGS